MSEFENIILEVNNSPKGQLIKNKSFISYLIKTINMHYGVKGNENTFPAPQPVSIEKKDFLKLKDYKYFTSLKLDGYRFIMYFIKDKNDKNQCIIINRALNFYNIHVDAEDTIYGGTLLDGEIIFNKDTNTWNYYIHDALLLCGNKINKLSHSTRLSDTRCCIESLINLDSSLNTLNIKVKEFYEFSNFNNFVEIYNNSDNNDGIIFMPENLPVISGTQYSMLKWKPQEKHTFDFLIKESEIGFDVFVFHMGDFKLFAKIHQNTPEGTSFIEKTKVLKNYNTECILECSFNKETNNFQPILIRTDKTHPNSLRTIERTLFNITENILISDFMDIYKESLNIEKENQDK